MYGNQYNPFIMSNSIPYNMPYTNIPRTFGKGITGSLGIRNIFNGARNINWQGMLNNVSRTLGIVREAIPVVKEVRPMINNMRSMIKIASVFKDETDTKTVHKTSDKKISSTDQNINNTTYQKKTNYNEPNFFL